MVVIDGKHLYVSGLVKNIEILLRNGPKTTHTAGLCDYSGYSSFLIHFMII